MTRILNYALATLIGLFCLLLASSIYAQPQLAVPAEPTPADAQQLAPEAGEPDEMQVLQQGPLHEAFAQPLALEAEAIVVERKPPEPINELPPDERPEGDNIHWLPGYWSFDPEREDFVWVSGFWRNFPPGRTWVPGEWLEVADGFQWAPGYWADAQVEQQVLLPAPPATLEQGPSSPAPGNNYLWAPGCWQWQNASYAWQPGYWYAAQPDWVWVPNHYCHTPRGVVYVRGYWDYPLVRRGLLYAPVYWGTGYRFGVNYYYRPRTLINTGLLAAHLFLDHGHGRYYFATNWGINRGYPSWVTPWGARGYGQWGRYHIHSNLYDPLWAHFHWNGHRSGAYGKSGKQVLTAQNFHKHHSDKPTDLMRNTNKLTSAEKAGMKLRRTSDGERAQLTKEVDHYRHMSRASTKSTERQLYTGNFKQRVTNNEEGQTFNGKATGNGLSNEIKRKDFERKPSEIRVGDKLTSQADKNRRELYSRMQNGQPNGPNKLKNIPSNANQPIRTDTVGPNSKVQSTVNQNSVRRWNPNTYTPRTDAGKPVINPLQRQQSIINQGQSQGKNQYRTNNNKVYTPPQTNPSFRLKQGQNSTPATKSKSLTQSYIPRPNSMQSNNNRAALQNFKPRGNQTMQNNTVQSTTRRMNSAPKLPSSAGKAMGRVQSGQMKSLGGGGKGGGGGGGGKGRGRR